MSSTAPTEACPHCSSTNIGVLTLTLLYTIYLCFNCGRKFERKRRASQKET